MPSSEPATDAGQESSDASEAKDKDLGQFVEELKVQEAGPEVGDKEYKELADVYEVESMGDEAQGEDSAWSGLSELISLSSGDSGYMERTKQSDELLKAGMPVPVWRLMVKIGATLQGTQGDGGRRARAVVRR